MLDLEQAVLEFQVHRGPRDCTHHPWVRMPTSLKHRRTVCIQNRTNIAHVLELRVKIDQKKSSLYAAPANNESDKHQLCKSVNVPISGNTGQLHRLRKSADTPIGLLQLTYPASPHFKTEQASKKQTNVNGMASTAIYTGYRTQVLDPTVLL